jgi:hypothetical protein
LRGLIEFLKAYGDVVQEIINELWGLKRAPSKAAPPQNVMREIGLNILGTYTKIAYLSEGFCDELKKLM